PFTDDSDNEATKQTPYTSLFGKRLKFTLVVVDVTEECKGDVDFCDSFEHSVYIQIPDRNPEIRLTVDVADKKKTAGTKEVTVIETGQTNKLSLIINEPYATCTAHYNASITLKEQLNLPFKPSMSSQDGVIVENLRCFGADFKHKFEVFVPDTHPKAIPFDITVNTSIGTRSIVTTFPFQIEPEQRVRVNGPSPGYAREKFVDISCHDISCNGFKIAYTDDPMSCAESGGLTDADFNEPDSLRAYGGVTSAMWRFSIDTESHNGEYLCVKAGTDNEDEDIYSLGLHQNLPTKVAIDATAPELTARYDPIQGKMNMDCTDVGDYKSGCAHRPFSYSYVVNPLQFAGSILTVGLLNAEWSGCPDGETGHYVTWNGAGGEMPYLSQDVRVMCIKATDNAGNYVVKSRLVYGSAEVLGGFLLAYARNQ
ncbi:hypothetical protein GOV07_02905, partial [Candidatus Woesearchaeota archaeon]|nr:hypothetical protein [Candidatus Woesearchaeota archaeon]